MATRKQGAPSDDNSGDNVQRGRGLWNDARGAAQRQEQRELDAARKAEARSAASEKRAIERAETAAKIAQRLIAPFAAYGRWVRNKPVVAVPVSVGSLLTIAFGIVQISNAVTVTPTSTASSYIDALRTHNVSRVVALETSESGVEWLPTEILDQVSLPPTTSVTSNWSFTEGTATVTANFDGVDNGVEFELVREATFGWLGWEYQWKVVPHTRNVTFTVSNALSQNDVLTVGDVSVGTKISPEIKMLASGTFRTVPGLLSLGVQQNGFRGGAARTYDLMSATTHELTFEPTKLDQTLVDRATSLALDSVTSQFDDCVDKRCNLLIRKWDDAYFSWDGEPPYYWTHKTWTDTFSSGGCELVVGPKLRGDFKETFTFLCSYNIDRVETWEDFGVEVANLTGTANAAVGIGIDVTTNKTGSTLKPGKIYFEPYGTDAY